MGKKILIVDDSALIRRQLGDLLDKEDYDIGFAKDGQEAVDFAMEVDFDLITMDINMPVMDGITAVKEIMAKKPTPILMVSSLTTDEADITFEALELGAVDFIAKPGTMTLKIEETKDEILKKIKSAIRIPKNRLKIRKRATLKKVQTQKALEKKSVLRKIPPENTKFDGLVLVGSSTGGVTLIEEIAESLPFDYPFPVCVVQHMPENFTAGFSQRLNNNSMINVVEGVNKLVVSSGNVIIAKGGKHMNFSKKASGVISVKETENIDKFFIPSVDEMYFSAMKVFDPKRIMAVQLTGIGDDGADGMVELRKRGAYTVGESPETAVIYGMPKTAYERGGVVKQLPFPKILEEILKFPDKLKIKINQES